jgi:uncharacterized pyridoxamine 5'-phosphate oxidase family protein
MLKKLSLSIDIEESIYEDLVTQINLLIASTIIKKPTKTDSTLVFDEEKKLYVYTAATKNSGAKITFHTPRFKLKNTLSS